MAAADYEVPEIREYIEVPELVEGTMAHSSPYKAKPDHQDPLGFPGELVDNWQEKAIDAMGDLLGKYRSLQVYLDSCVKCGSCTDKCHYYIGTQDPKNMPVGRQDLMRKVYRRYFTFAGKFFPKLVGAEDFTEEVLNDWYSYFHQCSQCRRCSVFCPYGIDTAEISMAAREIMDRIGVGQKYCNEIIAKVHKIGNNLGLPGPALADTLEGLEKSRNRLDAILAQTYPLAKMEVVIADGISEDGTREEIAAFQEEHPDFDVNVIDNPQWIIPAALNRAINVARGEIVVRLDAHAAPAPDYVARCVDALDEKLGDNVGGVWDIRPNTEGWVAASIAAAAAHPLGVGDAFYRHATQAQIVDTVPFGAFRRELVEKIGLFDETLLANEDYEFNARVRQSGGRIWLDPAIRSIYFSRPTLDKLAKQYFNYGYWKWQMLRRYPKTLRWRQFLPPVFVLSLFFLFVVGFFYPPTFYLLLLELLLYFSILFVAGMKINKPGLPLAIAVMHISWGSGLLWSALLSLLKANND